MSEEPEKQQKKMLVFFGRDFMIGSRVEGVARNHSLQFRRIEKKEALQENAAAPELVLFDLSATGDELPIMVSIMREKHPETPLVGLAFHTDQDSLDKGRHARLDHLITRSGLVDGLNRILEKGD